MGRNSPSARLHRALRALAHLEQYRRLGPLIGPKEAHQPDHRWPSDDVVEPEARPHRGVLGQ